MMKRAIFSAVLAVPLMWSNPAGAFNTGKTFVASANNGGGGGLLFTGATRWRRYDCTICHVDTAGSIGIELDSDPADLLTTGEWVPGQRYRINVRLTGEHTGLSSASNINTFMADITDGERVPLGQFGFDSTILELRANGTAIGALPLQNRTAWSFDFTAPTAGRGRLELNIAAVDGNGADNTESRITDLLGDDVATRSISLCERGTPCETEETPPTRVDSTASGCSAGSGSTGSWPMLLFAWLALAVGRRAGFSLTRAGRENRA